MQLLTDRSTHRQTDIVTFSVASSRQKTVTMENEKKNNHVGYDKAGEKQKGLSKDTRARLLLYAANQIPPDKNVD